MEEQVGRKLIRRMDVEVSWTSSSSHPSDGKEETTRDAFHEKLVLLQCLSKKKKDRDVFEGGTCIVRSKMNRGLLELERKEEDVSGDGMVRSFRTCRVRGTHVPLRAPMAVGILDGGKMHISILHHCLQMRPVLQSNESNDSQSQPLSRDDHGRSWKGSCVTHLDTDRDESVQPRETVQVRVRKRETERQEEARFQSHAFMREQEEEEPWKCLKIVDARADATKCWWAEQGSSKVDAREPVLVPLNKRSKEVLLSNLNPEHKESLGERNKAGMEPKASTPSCVLVRELVGSLLADMPMLSEEEIHEQLLQAEQIPDAELALLDREALDSVLEGVAVRLGSMYIRDREGGEDARIRHAIIKRFRCNRRQTKASMMDAVCQELGYEPAPNIYNKLMKEMCLAQGNEWVFKDNKT